MTGRFFRDPDTGRIAVVQLPNTALGLYLAATAARIVFHPNGAVGAAVSVTAAAGLVWWSVDEIVRGVSPFRRVLGGVVLTAFVANLLR